MGGVIGKASGNGRAKLMKETMKSSFPKAVK